ncbi:unnamed protein product [Lupinus luteus]|uniref:Uncharacterized protein n=1 Tax=Lupinus luteus TaxID=3873 RepID=A0AAV1VZI8_LUPLU
MEKFFALVKSTKDVIDLLSKEKMDKKVEDDYKKAMGSTVKEKDYFQGGGTSVAVAPEAETQVKEKAGNYDSHVEENGFQVNDRVNNNSTQA